MDQQFLFHVNIGICNLHFASSLSQFLLLFLLPDYLKLLLSLVHLDCEKWRTLKYPYQEVQGQVDILLRTNFVLFVLVSSRYRKQEFGFKNAAFTDKRNVLGS